MSGRSNTVNAVKTSVRVLEALYELDGARVSELAEHLDLAKSSVHRHLSTLEAAEYVIQEETTYYLSLQFLELGDYVRKRKPVYDMALPKVNELCDETGERSQFVVEEHGYVRYVHRSTSDRAVMTTSGIGKRIRMHAIAGGKAILAFLPEVKVRQIITRRGLPAFTDRTITDESELFDELASIRDRGVSYNDEECVPGLRAVGVPVRGPNGDVLGALTVAGPTHRMKDDVFRETVPELLLGAANELELKYAYE